MALPWVDKVKAVLEMWWPGDEGGWSTANLLLGKVSPAGRLPVTWGKSLDDYPATDPKHPERSSKGVDHKTTYSEGVNVGYRWFDKENIGRFSLSDMASATPPSTTPASPCPKPATAAST